MKRLLFITVLCALAAASCGRQELDVPESGHTLVLTAYVPSDSQADQPSPATRISVAQGGKVSWTAGDEIAVYNSSGQKFKATLTEGADTPKGTFTCSSFSGTPGQIAVYPYHMAGDTPGQVTIPRISARTDQIPALMASKLESIEDNQPRQLYFKHIAPVIDLTLEDIPAYARALVLKAGNKLINGTLTFDPATLGPIQTQDLTSSSIITLDSCEGYGKQLHFYYAVPPGEYSQLSIGLMDGDEAYIEGLQDIIIKAPQINLSPKDYVRMPLLNIRDRCTRSNAVRKVEGTLWAAGNLIAQSGGATSEGFQSGWRIASQQYEFLGCDQVGSSGSGVTYTQNASAFDRFNWGGVAGDAWLPGSGYMLPSDAKFSISGRIFSISSGSGEDLEAAELRGDDCFATPSGGSMATGSALHGDVAYWASKGQYRMPTPSEFTALRAGNAPTNASGKAGYVTVGNNRIYGVLLTSTPSWETSTLNTTAVELTPADLESGLFLPKAGRGRYISGSNSNIINYVNAQGYYRTGTFSGLDLSKYPNSDHCTTVLGFRAANSCDYGYTIHLNSDTAWGVGHVQKCLPIRPVLCSGGAEPVPDPLPQPDANTLPAWSAGYLDIHAINSGRGECTLVIMPDGTSMMIDAGEYYTSSAKAVDQKPNANIRPFKVYTAYAKYFLKATGHEFLDYFLLTHYHQDHMGQHRTAYGTSGDGYCRSGVMAVYDDLPIKKLVDRCGPSVTPTTSDYSADVYEDFKQFASYRKATDGMEWYPINLNASGNYKKQFILKYDTSYDFCITNLGGNGKYWNGIDFSTYSGNIYENGACATVLISYGQFDYYSGGDCACQSGIMQRIASGLNKKVEAMKATHHMYYNTLDAATANILRPKVTVAQIFDSDKPGDPAFSFHRQWGDVFITNIHQGRLDNSADIKGGTPVDGLGSKVKDYGGHFVIRVSPGGSEFYVYKLRDTDFSYSVEATYGPYSCY